MNHYIKHLRALAAELGCGLRLAPNIQGMMYVEFGYVEGPTPSADSLWGGALGAYYVNLHELGHFALGHTQGRPPKDVERFYFDNGVLHSEAQAWEWALDKGKKPPSDRVRYLMDFCLSSYYNGYVEQDGSPYRLQNGDRHHVEFVFDEPDRYFWSIARRMAGLLEPAA